MNVKVNNNLSDLVELDIVEKDDEITINVNKKIKILCHSKKFQWVQ